MGQQTAIVCDAGTTVEDLAPTLVPFAATNACDAAVVFVDAANRSVRDALETTHVEMRDIEDLGDASDWYNVIMPSQLADNVNTPKGAFPPVGLFVSLYFPLGHVKSAMVNDEGFVDYFSQSEKWLRVTH